jgi:hypothetical protein
MSLQQVSKVRRTSALALLFLVVVAILGFMDPSALPFVSAGSSNSSSASGATVTNAKCAQTPHYLVQSNHFFGPAVTQPSVTAQEVVLHNRLCEDPALVVALSKYVEISGYSSLNGNALTIRADQLAADPLAWAHAVTALETKEAGKPVSDVTMSGSYQTLYMVRQPKGAPLIRAAVVDRTRYIVLRIGKWDFKLNCGFQPVAKAFHGVTALPPAEVPSTPTSPPAKRIVTTPTTPTTVQFCQTHSMATQCHPSHPKPTPRKSKCHCTTKQQVKIPVNSQNPGVSAGTTPGAPSVAPTTSPTAPPAQTNTSAPPSNGSGYSDGTQGTGGSTCDTTGCTGGGSTSTTSPPGTTDGNDTPTTNPPQPS